jgi:hypothetical protein
MKIVKMKPIRKLGLKGRLKSTYTVQTLLAIENKLFQLLTVTVEFCLGKVQNC